MFRSPLYPVSNGLDFGAEKGRDRLKIGTEDKRVGVQWLAIHDSEKLSEVASHRIGKRLSGSQGARHESSADGLELSFGRDLEIGIVKFQVLNTEDSSNSTVWSG